MTAGTEPLLTVRDAEVRIGDATLLRAGELTLEAGRLVAVVGPNGAGKSTLARVAAGLQPVERGSVRWDGRDIGALRRRELARIRAFVPQRPRVPEGMSVREAVTIGRSPHVGALRRAGRHDEDAVERAMRRAEVAAFADRSLTTLSGGELQRVQVAVGLAQEARALIADEPTAHLDLGATTVMAKLMRGLADDGLGVLLVVHDVALAAAVADTVVVMSRGRTVAAGPPVEVLTRERLGRIWGVDAALQSTAGRTALHVAWLGQPVAEDLLAPPVHPTQERVAR